MSQKITKLIITCFKGSSPSEVNPYIAIYENQGYEYVSTQIAMASSGDNSLISAQTTIVVTMQKDSN